jgi:N-acetylneuraminate synthase
METQSKLCLGDRYVGDNEPCYVIAEVGVNHNGDLATAKRLVDEAVRAGADAVKFQKRHLQEVYSQDLLNQPRHGEQGLQYILPLLVEFELDERAFRELRQYCEAKEITFFCTPWDASSLRLLESMHVLAYKIGSPDLTNLPLIEQVIRTGKPLLLSTGMSTEEEIRRTIAFLREQDAEYALLHCVSTYPTAPEEVNLRFMQRLREWSGRPVGYSGHDTGIDVSLAAVALGASFIEKHITLDRMMRGPDHKASLEPDEFAALVRGVRNVEKALGVARRWMTRGEVLNRRVLGKSLVAAEEIPAGTVIERGMVASKSPGMGLSPQRLDELVGCRLARKVSRDEAFQESDLVPSGAPRRLKRIDVGTRWGVVARFLDVDQLLERFEPAGLSLIEFHVSDRDLDEGIAAFQTRRYSHELVVHAPEYFHDNLIDLCSADVNLRLQSVQRIQQCIDLTRKLAPCFTQTSAQGPKLVFHVGGMSPRVGHYDLDAACERLLDSVSRLDTSEVDLLLENLPPFPWYFGGQWFGHVLTDPATTERLCAESELGLCFDTSHAALQCHRTGENLVEFAARLKPYIRHLHVSDGAGNSGEGLQIGEGQINFVELMPVLLETKATMVPEIWMGHHEKGNGFRIALEHLTDIVWATSVLTRRVRRGASPELRDMVVPESATLMTTLQVIDANRHGIAFIVDENDAVLGVVTDGDIRHGLVRGKNLYTAVTEIMTCNFTWASPESNLTQVFAEFTGRTRIVPLLDDSRRLVGFATDPALAAQVDVGEPEDRLPECSVLRP